MNSIIPLQNSPERVSLLPIAPGVDFATAVALRRMATSTGATPAYLLAPEVSALLWYMPDQRHHMLFATMWNTGIRIGEARTLTPESFDLDGLRPFVRVLSEKVRARRGRPPKDEVRLVPLTDASFVRQMESWMVTTRPRRREPLWPVTDEALAGHKDPRSMEVYTRVFALDMAATLAVPFTGDGRDAAEILRSLPPAG
ncbi:MAG: site-specific integrase [Thomasclavelia ramosa]|nr:site-specific integrase [Thomasclavelia ramosa]